MVQSSQPKPAKVKRAKKSKFTKALQTNIPAKQTDHYQTDSVFLRRMTKDQKNGLSLLFRGVVDAEITLDNGKIVKHPVDAVRWLLEQINTEFKNNS